MALPALALQFMPAESMQRRGFWAGLHRLGIGVRFVVHFSTDPPPNDHPLSDFRLLLM